MASSTAICWRYHKPWYLKKNIYIHIYMPWDCFINNLCLFRLTTKETYNLLSRSPFCFGNLLHPWIMFVFDRCNCSVGICQISSRHLHSDFWGFCRTWLIFSKHSQQAAHWLERLSQFKSCHLQWEESAIHISRVVVKYGATNMSPGKI